MFYREKFVKGRDIYLSWQPLLAALQYVYVFVTLSPGVMKTDEGQPRVVRCESPGT
jgi:hypothetical protein